MFVKFQFICIEYLLENFCILTVYVQKYSYGHILIPYFDFSLLVSWFLPDLLL